MTWAVLALAFVVGGLVGGWLWLLRHGARLY